MSGLWEYVQRLILEGVVWPQSIWADTSSSEPNNTSQANDQNLQISSLAAPPSFPPPPSQNRSPQMRAWVPSPGERVPPTVCEGHPLQQVDLTEP